MVMRNKKLFVSLVCVLILMFTGVCYADVGGLSPAEGGDASPDAKKAMVTAFMEIWGDGEAEPEKVVFSGRSIDKGSAGQLLYWYDDYKFYFDAKTGKLCSVRNLSGERRTLSEQEGLAKADETMTLVYGGLQEGAYQRRIEAHQMTAVYYDFCKDDVFFPAAVFRFDADDAFSTLSLTHPDINEYTFGDFISEEDSLAYAKAAVKAYAAEKYQNMDVDEKLGKPDTEGRKAGIFWAKRIAWTWKIEYEDNEILGYNLAFQVAVDALDGHILSLASNIGGYSEQPAIHDDIEYFLTRLYENFLGREPDEKGLNDWLNALLTGYATGSKVVYGFVYSPEFQANPLSNEEYVTAMYHTIFGREPDANGLSAWVSVLEQGCTRKKILEGFLNSKEMRKLCVGMGVEPGSYQSDDVLDRNTKLTFFVNRFYKYGLGRQADEAGLRGWVSSLARHEIDGHDIARAFFTGDEFCDIERNKGLYAALSGMYMAMAEKEISEEEFKSWDFPEYWVILDNKYGGVGGDIDSTLLSLLRSSEYQNLCESYGDEYGGNVIIIHN
jgi:hypothetical protein